MTPKQWARRLSFPLRAPAIPAGVQPPEKVPNTGVDFETAWARRPVARVARRVLHEALIEPSVRLITDPTLRGLDRLEHLDEDQPLIFVANHHSHLDTPLLLRRLPKPWRDKLFVGAAADYFFPNRIAGTAAALALNAIPIERTKVNRRSALHAASLIDAGWSLLIFPEGGRSPDGWGQEFKGGAAYLAIRCEVPVVPVYVDGTDRIMPKGKNLPSPGSTTLTFGAPLYASAGEDARRMAQRIESAVAALADEATTDWWQARKRAHAGLTPSLGGPDAVSWRRAWARTATRPTGGGRSTGKTTQRRWPDF